MTKQRWWFSKPGLLKQTLRTKMLEYLSEYLDVNWFLCCYYTLKSLYDLYIYYRDLFMFIVFCKIKFCSRIIQIWLLQNRRRSPNLHWRCNCDVIILSNWIHSVRKFANYIKMSYQKNIRLRSDPRLDSKWSRTDIGNHYWIFSVI